MADAPDADDVVRFFRIAEQEGLMPYLATDSLKVGLWDYPLLKLF